MSNSEKKWYVDSNHDKLLSFSGLSRTCNWNEWENILDSRVAEIYKVVAISVGEDVGK